MPWNIPMPKIPDAGVELPPSNPRTGDRGTKGDCGEVGVIVVPVTVPRDDTSSPVCIQDGEQLKVFEPDREDPPVVSEVDTTKLEADDIWSKDIYDNEGGSFEVINL